MLFFGLGLMFSSEIASAQKERNIWYFGFGAGVDFNSGSPVALTDGKLITEEGCATICNASGNLLFYTDGGKVWNRNHTVMPNGTGLKGNLSSTQSAVVVKKPGSTNLYYLFTVDDIGGSDGLEYSIVDMTLDNGLGNVTSTKNVLMMTPTCEKIAVVKHSNGTDYWIITHHLDENKFSAFTLTASGVSTTPVVTTIGKSITGKQYGYTVGYLKASPDGKMLACATYDSDYLLVTDFDASSGKLSNERNLNTGGSSNQRIYGVEFSASGRYLYATQITGSQKIVQYDLSNSTTSAIQNSMVMIKQYSQNLGAMQMGPDGKIYITYANCSYLLCIQYPDLPGTQCGFLDNAVYLEGKHGDFGLPTFISSVTSEVTYDSFCPGEFTQFHVSSSEMDSVRWNFGDPSSGSANNTSTELEPKHKFSAVKTFTVEVTVFYSGASKKLTLKVTVPTLFKPELGKDTTICKGEKIVLNASPASGPFVWNDGSTNATLTVTQAGTYVVNADVGECLNRDTIVVNVYNPVPVDLGNDTSMCIGDSIYLSALPNPGPYFWNNGSALSGLMIKKSGQYWVKTTDGNCSSGDTVNVAVYNRPTIELGPDSLVCDTNQFLVTAIGVYDGIVWDDGSTNKDLIVTSSSTLHATVNIGTCKVMDAVTITFGEKANLKFGDSTILCDDEVVKLDAKTFNSQYLWQDGSKQEILRITEPGKYWVTVTNDCGIYSDTTIVYKASCKCFLYIPNAFTPNHDGLNENYGPVTDGCNFIKYHFAIFNLWGEKIFESFVEGEKWDGIYRGKIVQSDCYVYLFEGTTWRYVKVKDSGTVTVLR